MEIEIGDSILYRGFSWSVVQKEGEQYLLIADKCLTDSQFYHNPLMFKERWTAEDYKEAEKVSNRWEVSEIPSVLKRLGLEEATLLTREKYEKEKSRIPVIPEAWWLKDSIRRSNGLVVEPNQSVREVAVGKWFYGIRPVVVVAASVLKAERERAEAEQRRKEEEQRKEEERKKRQAEERKIAMELYWKGQGEFGIGESKRAGKTVFFADRHWTILGERKDSFLCLSHETFFRCPFNQREERWEDGWSGKEVQQLCKVLVDVPESKVMLDDPKGEKFPSEETGFLLSKSLYERFQRWIPKTCGLWWLSTSSLHGAGEQWYVNDKEDGSMGIASCENELGLRLACFLPKEAVRFGWNASFLESFQEGDCYLLNEVILCEESRYILGVPSEGGGLQESLFAWCKREFRGHAKVANMTTWQYERYKDKIEDIGKKWLLLDYVDGYLTYVKAVGEGEEEEYGIRPMLLIGRT